LLSGTAAAAFREVFGFHSVERHLLADPIDRVATLFVFERFDLLFERFPLCKRRAVPGIRYPALAPEIDDVVFDTVCAALYRDESLHIVYRPADAAEGVTRDYLVLPYAIVEKGPFWYLVVSLRRSSGAQGDPFLLRMDRITSVEPRGYRMERDASFDLTAYICSEKIFEWFPEPPEQVVLRVTEAEGVRSSFRALRLAADQVIADEPGGFILTATMTPSLALRNLPLEHASTVELLAPARMRAQIAQQLEAAARRYALEPRGLALRDR
jgi:predicted DNA-binding transcriptional regulator YafY